MQIPISAANWIPVSASYTGDTNLNLTPTLVTWGDGYTAFSHPLFTNVRSVAVNRNTLLMLTSATSLFDVVSEPVYGSLNTGSYISLKTNGRYITNINGSLYLSDSAITDNSFFRLIPNTDGSFSFMQGNTLYVTVAPYLPYELTIQTQSVSAQDRQSFGIYSADADHIYVTTTFNNPFSSYGPARIYRFWSCNVSTSAIQCIGTAADASLHNANPYIFTLDGVGLISTLDGLTRDQTWIRYYNETNSTTNNKNTEICPNHIISGVNVNRLVELPYLTNITVNGLVGNMEVNIANLKNILTPEYENHTIPEGQQ